MKRVVVTGLGALTPIGNSTKEYWNGLINGVSGAAPITLFDASNFKTQFACEVKGFDELSFLDRKEARKMDRFTHLGLAVADEALVDSGLLEEKINSDRVGVIWGSGIGGLRTFHDETANFVNRGNTPRFNPFFIPKMIVDITPGHISIKYGFRGPNYSTVSACASASHAIIDALTQIRLGKADVILTGGSEAAVTESGIGGFNAMQALSTRNEDPKTASRPFDQGRDGFVLGEGAAGIVLEEYEHAKARGAKIYCELAGGGMSADAYHLTAPHPEGLGVIKVMNDVLDDAQLTKTDVDYINVHGTSTPLGDVLEVNAIQKVFGDHATKMNISSTKSMTGHLLGAAGAVEAAACIMSIQNNMVPPTINHFDLDEKIDPSLNLTFNKPQERTVDVAISNTFGFGGHNASVLFKRI